MTDAPILVLDSSECEKMISEATTISRTHAVRSPENVALPIQNFASRFIKSPAPNARPVAVFCVLESDVPIFYAIDAVCYHGKADLTQGSLVRGVCDVEDLGHTSIPLCVECPGHGYLFSLATGSNIIRGAQFLGGKLVVGGLKAVARMQRTYECVFDPAAGLAVFNKTRRHERFASDSQL
jgi:nitrite reductase/ring-hydroxylating ferredoxin subunit